MEHEDGEKMILENLLKTKIATKKNIQTTPRMKNRDVLRGERIIDFKIIPDILEDIN